MNSDLRTGAVKAISSLGNHYAPTYKDARSMARLLENRGIHVVDIYLPRQHVKHITDYIICWRQYNE